MSEYLTRADRSDNDRDRAAAAAAALTAAQVLAAVVRDRRLGREREAQLARALRRHNIAAYEGELDRLAEELGYEDAPRARLDDPARKRLLGQDALWAAAAIAATFNGKLAAIAESYQASRQGQINRHDLSEAVNEWTRGYWEWKSREVAVTENAWAHGRARLDWFGVNGISAMVRVVPSPYICPVCQGYAAMGWMPLRQGLELMLPAHINCPHELEVRVAPGTRMPSVGDLWMGGRKHPPLPRQRAPSGDRSRIRRPAAVHKHKHELIGGDTRGAGVADRDNYLAQHRTHP